MRYLGGKAKIAKRLAAAIAEHLRPGQCVWEPFCGGLNLTSALASHTDVIATDASVPLMSLLLAVRDGWDPPGALTEAEWRAAMALPVTDPLHGFAAFGISFGGKYGRGFARPSEPGAARRALLRDVPRAGALALVDFFAVEPCPTESAIYCDPPYAGRTGYGACAPFDPERFVERVAAWAALGVTVLVSEYAFPIGEVVWEHERAAYMRGRETTHIERLYLVGGKL